jgi:hypothetical protein
MTTRNRTKTVLTLAAVAMVLLVLPAVAEIPGPNDLPDPDTTPPDTTKPVKVYILSGQSNMVGIGYVNDPDPGSLSTVTAEGTFPHLVDAAGAWTVRNDVWYEGVITATAKKWLTIGCGADSGKIGPELQFGHIMGYYHDEPVIVLKTSQGNRSIGWDCLPPGSERYIYGDYTYAGYGDSPNRWLTEGGGPSPYGWYAGKQYDDYFLNESDMGPTGWADATDYPQNCQVCHNGVVYISKSAHTSSAASEPGIGAQSSTYWSVYSVFNVIDVLDNFDTKFPQWAAQGFEIAGYGWWQGHKDQYDASYADRYEFNLENFINEVRGYYENLYPNNIKPNAPFVVATIGFGGVPYTPGTAYYKIYTAQMTISDPVKHPDFAGNVASVDTLGYWRSVEESPGNQGHHYNNNAWTYMMVGDAMGRAMVELLTHLVFGDCNKDGRVDFKDLAVLALYWSETNCGQCGGADLTGDEKVDNRDVAEVAKYWLTATTIPPLPEQASNPNPTDNATGVDTTTNLSWTAGADAISHDVYFGTSNPPPFIRNQSLTTFDPGDLPKATKFYWRIDEINGWGKTGGLLWSFKTATGPPPPPPT